MSSLQSYLFSSNILAISLLLLHQLFLLTFILLKVFEKIYQAGLFYILLFLNLNFTTRKKYLQEKFRPTKEKLARAKTWAWKHEGKLTTYKGFYIPVQLPITEQAKFFQKKWDLDEQKIRDEELQQEHSLYHKNTDDLSVFEQDINFWSAQESLVKTTIFSEDFFEKKLSDNNSEQLKLHFYKSRCRVFQILDKKFEKQIINSNPGILYKTGFIFKFTKKFLKSPVPPFKIISNQHLFSYLNVGFDTSQFLNFFLIHHYPAYLINFNFLKIKILIFKKLKLILNSGSYPLHDFLVNWNLPIILQHFTFNSNYFLTPKAINNFFFFIKIFNEWQNIFFDWIFFKNLIFTFLSAPSLNSKVLKFMNYISLYFNDRFKTKKPLKIFLKKLFFNRLLGGFDFCSIKSFSWRKHQFQINFFTNKNTFYQKFYLKFLVKFKQYFKMNMDKFSSSYTFPYKFFFIEFVFSDFDILMASENILNWSILSVFLENFSLSNGKISNEIFPLSRTVTKTFFIFLWNWIKHYESMWNLLYTSFSQQVKIIEDINVPDMLFRYIIRKGKKLTARTVFFKFLKKFKKKYSLPGLAIFTHAMLMVEPNVWLKKKKIAGRLYEIPIYISSNRSKCIAIRWLLQAAKKWKRASITESLSQEVWDACFKKGGAFANKELVQLTVKRNKAYLRWF